MQPRVHAVVLNYNQQAAALQAVAELGRSRDVDVDVLVVDCASAQADRAALQQHVTPDRLLLLPENRGYAGGMNAGIKFWLERAPEVPVMLVTPDARVAPEVAHGLFAALYTQPDVGVVGPLIVTQDMPRRVTAGGSIDGRGRVQPIAEVTGGEPYDVDWIDGCCMLLRPEALRAVHGFDEAYFLYYEETDLCVRLRQAGWRVRVVPSVSVLHPKARDSAPPHFYYYMARNGYRFRARHFGVGNFGVGLDLARSTLLLTSLALAATVLPQHWHQARDRWRNCRLQWRGVLAGTRDHLKGRYGARGAPTPHPG
ncbi:MAG TPA: glycosyltransferase family 2 protein [Longimicrobiales bacterium]